MNAIKEGNLEFVFGASWNVLKYDKNGSYYKTQMEKNVKPTKAVDFLCLCNGQPLLMLEVKDFSQGVPKREKFNKIPMVVAIKIRDTISGIVGGSNKASDKTERIFFQSSCQKITRSPRVIYFFEDLATPARRPLGRAENKKNVLLKQLKKRLRWLTTDIAVVGLKDFGKFIADLKIQKV